MYNSWSDQKTFPIQSHHIYMWQKNAKVPLLLEHTVLDWNSAIETVFDSNIYDRNLWLWITFFLEK